MSSLRMMLIASSLLLIAGGAAALSGVPLGPIVVDADHPGVGEAFTIPESVTAAVRQLEIDDQLVLEAFPVAPGQRTLVRLVRVDLYATGSRVVRVDRRGESRLPRSNRIQLLGTSLDGRTRLGFTLDPEDGSWRGLMTGPDGSFQLTPPTATDARHRLQYPANAVGGHPLESGCGFDSLPSNKVNGPSFSAPPVDRGPAAASLEAVIAVDTDNEFNFLKFANNTTSATNWIADLFVEMNVMYERDLDLTLVQGETFLRLDLDGSPTFDDDPWTVTGTTASSAHLAEFGSFWSTNMGGVERVLAMFLGGKSSSDFSSSGIAWIDGICEAQATGGAYSVTMVFKASVAVVNDVRVIAHELGHNFGSPHTHCYSPPVDECYNLGGGGCYGGAESCPAAGTGSMMSYCHFSSHANCGSNRVEFDPTVITWLSGFVSSHTFSGCIEPSAGSSLVFQDGFESGDTSAWSSEFP